ncbi:stalk domain-containing protein [Gracilibacillus xinjiangensis]|uniref:Stalk domain-containing protein n=1 Tax=Gracilibacillus xinjiangensis TaxID=1193282 RepID=A0ABV8WWF6_9BACI
MSNGLQKGIIVILLLFCLLPTENIAAVELDFLSKEEIKKMGQEVEKIQIRKTHEEAPSISYPYQLGKVDESLLHQAIQGTNFVRRLAGLPGDVIINQDLNDLAQHGALLLAASQDFSHNPKRPADMDEELYKKGYQSTSSSNISYGRDNLWANIRDGYMPDTGHNIDEVGHRRWILNPPLQKTGFGLVAGNGTMQVFDQSRQEQVEYDYIAWPVSSFPSEIFKGDHPWSVSLNPDKYQAPDVNDVQVVLAREYDNKQWVFDHEDNNISSMNNYFTVDNQNFGINNAIIFRPKGISRYVGKYKVKITGIRNLNGEPVPVEYEVDFFSMDNYFSKGEKELIKIGIILESDYAYLFNQEDQIELYHDRPFIYRNHTMVPLRLITEYLKMNVSWDQESGEIEITEGNTIIKLQANSEQAFINDQLYHLDVEPQIINGVTFVPVRFISEGLGAKVDWNHKENKVTISRIYTH